MNDDRDAATDRTVAELVRTVGDATLATLEPDGHPFASLVGLAVAPGGTPLTLLSSLARHTRNLQADPRASLLLRQAGTGDDPLTGARLTLVGRLQAVPPEATEAARSTYLSRHPAAAAYADFADFAWYRMVVASAHLVAGFGRIETLDKSRLDRVLAAGGAGRRGRPPAG